MAEKSEPLPISVVVCVKNAEATLGECLKSVKANNVAQIVVVDGLSRDRTVQIARRYTTDIYSDGGKGPGPAHQIGAQESNQDYIAYVDADIELPNDSLRSMLTELVAYNCDCIVGRVLGWRLSTFWERTTQRHSDILVAEIGFHLQATLLRRKVALAIGFRQLLAGEDVGFRLGFRESGYEAKISRAFVYHHHVSDFRSFAKQARRNGRGRADLAWQVGLLRLEFWPPIGTLYRSMCCFSRMDSEMLKFYLIKGFFESAGFFGALLTMKKRAFANPKFPRPRLKFGLATK